MLKRITLLLLTLTLVFGGLVTAHALDQEEVYTALQEELLRYLNGEEGAMPLDTLATQFNNLGRYKKSPLFGYYTSLLRDAEAGDTSRLELYTRLLRLDADFCAMLPESGFPTVDEVEAYALGREAQAAGDWPAAIGYYEESIAVLDSVTRVMELLTAEPVLVAEGVVCGDYAIDTYSDRTCVITDYTGSERELVVPEFIDKYHVIKIGDFAFIDCNFLTAVILPDSILAIGDDAFYCCRSLTSINLPNGLTTIGDEPFFYCKNLTTITLPDTLTHMGHNPFNGCVQLTEIIVSPTHSVFSVIDGALFDMTEQKLICYPQGYNAECYTVPSFTKVIGADAFCNNRKLTSIILPHSVTIIEQSAFANIENLISISLPDSITAIHNYTFRLCGSLTTITIPNSVTSIGISAFESCESLTSITIPDSVTFIETWAFYDCPNLTLRVPANSYAHQYAIENNIPYTTY